jgi:hypothetical protein
VRRDNRASLAGILAHSGSELDLAYAWGVMGPYLHELAFGFPLREADVEARIGVPSGVLTPFYRELAGHGYLNRSDDGSLSLTGSGRTEAEKLSAAWKSWLMGELQGWLKAHEVSAEQTALIEAAIGRIALRLVREAQAEARRPSLASASASTAG